MTSSSSSGGFLDGGCCAGAGGEPVAGNSMTRPARGARAAAGAVFLVLAGAMSTRRLPGRVALWPASLVPTWFGISHLLAAVTGYRGCPELGAIPSVLLDRSVGTTCETWERIDRRVISRWERLGGRSAAPAPGRRS